jgi:hypothetical protein
MVLGAAFQILIFSTSPGVMSSARQVGFWHQA